MRIRKSYFIIPLLTAFTLNSCKNEPKPNDSREIVGEYEAELTYAPYVPERKDYENNKKVIVKMEVVEKVMRLADGVDYNSWTFGGQVPGQLSVFPKGIL